MSRFTLPVPLVPQGRRLLHGLSQRADFLSVSIAPLQGHYQHITPIPHRYRKTTFNVLQHWHNIGAAFVRA